MNRQDVLCFTLGSPEELAENVRAERLKREPLFMNFLDTLGCTVESNMLL